MLAGQLISGQFVGELVEGFVKKQTSTTCTMLIFCLLLTLISCRSPIKIPRNKYGMTNYNIDLTSKLDLFKSQTPMYAYQAFIYHPPTPRQVLHALIPAKQMATA